MAWIRGAYISAARQVPPHGDFHRTNPHSPSGYRVASHVAKLQNMFGPPATEHSINQES